VIWPFVSRRAYEQQWAAYERLMALYQQSEEAYRRLAEMLLKPPIVVAQDIAHGSGEPSRPEGRYEPKEALSTEVELMISQIAERDPGLRQQLTAHAYKLVENGTPMDEVCEHLLKPFEVEA
jgi:hypothetical protein